MGKIEIIKNWCWYYYEILKSFSEIISVKSRKTSLKKMLKRYKKHCTKKYFDVNFVKVSGQLSKEFTKNCTEILNNSRKKLQSNPEEIPEKLWGAIENLFRGASRLNPAPQPQTWKPCRKSLKFFPNFPKIFKRRFLHTLHHFTHIGWKFRFPKSIPGTIN